MVHDESFAEHVDIMWSYMDGGRYEKKRHMSRSIEASRVLGKGPGPSMFNNTYVCVSSISCKLSLIIAHVKHNIDLLMNDVFFSQTSQFSQLSQETNVWRKSRQQLANNIMFDACHIRTKVYTRGV